jgi:hypothetical protein
MSISERSAEPDEKPLDPAQAKIVAKVRWLMLISGLTTFVGIAAIVGVIGYRVYRGDGSANQGDVVAALPKGARIVATSVGAERIAVTVELGGATEVHIFDLKTLKPTGRLRFVNEP